MNEHVPVSFEYSYAATGLWYENRAFPTGDGLAVFFNDITPRKQAELALQASEACFRQLAESLPQFVWISGADGLIEYVNTRSASLFAMTMHQLYRCSLVNTASRITRIACLPPSAVGA